MIRNRRKHMMCWKKAGQISLFFYAVWRQSIEPLQQTKEAEAESLSAVQMKELPFEHLHLHVQYEQKSELYEASYRQAKRQRRSTDS
ncbi:hypothetical protein ACEQPO_24630 [Bacillus sp. SL00103]